MPAKSGIAGTEAGATKENARGGEPARARMPFYGDLVQLGDERINRPAKKIFRVVASHREP